MAFFLPEPKTPQETLAFALIRELELTYNLTAGAPQGPWLVAMLTKLRAGLVDRPTIVCATRYILRQGGQNDRPFQWAILSVASCFDVTALNVRTQFAMSNLVIALVSLYRAYASPTGLDPIQLRLIGSDLIGFLMREGDPAFRLQLSDIELFRRCYHQLRIMLFGS